MSADYNNFYKNALLYLTCIKMEDLSKGELQERAHDLCIAALLASSIYNFGELLAHPILESLQSTQMAYLHQSLLAFNAGNHDEFAKLLPLISKHPALAPQLEKLQQKMYLMSLVETVFKQLKSSRTLSFSIISQSTRVALEQVEFLLMKALSLGLIRGSIDEPEQTFMIEWVQPRVLDREQITELRAGIQAWRNRVQETSRMIFSMMPEQLVAVSNTI